MISSLGKLIPFRPAVVVQQSKYQE